MDTPTGTGDNLTASLEEMRRLADIQRMMDEMRGNPDFNDAITAWIDADQAREKAAAALERAERTVQRREDALRAIYERAKKGEARDCA